MERHMDLLGVRDRREGQDGADGLRRLGTQVPIDQTLPGEVNGQG